MRFKHFSLAARQMGNIMSIFRQPQASRGAVAPFYIARMLWAAIFCLAAPLAWGQAPTSQPMSQPMSKPMSKADMPNGGEPPPADTVTVEAVDAALKQIAEDSTLDDAAKTKLKDLYTQAKAALDEAKKQQESAARYAAWAQNASQELEKAQKDKASPPPGYSFADSKFRSLSDLQADLKQLEKDLAEQKLKLPELQAEPQRRVNRKAEIPKAITDAQEAIKKIDEQLKTAAPDAASPALAQAKTIQLRAQRQALLAQLRALQAEVEAYEAEGELPRLRIDLATARTQQLEQDVQKLLEIVTQRSKDEAKDQRDDLAKRFKDYPAPLQPYVRDLLQLAGRRLSLAGEIQIAAENRQAVSEKLSYWKEDFARARRWTEEINADSLGEMLLRRRFNLPSPADLQPAAGRTGRSLSDLLQEIYVWDERRSDLSDMNAAVTTALAQMQAAGANLPADADDKLKELFTAEAELLDTLLKDAKRHYELRLSTREDRTALANLVKEYREFINGHIFWVRHQKPLGPADFQKAGRALAWLLDPSAWGAAVEAAWRKVQNQPLSAGLFGVTILVLTFYRRRMRRKLTELGQVAASISCDSIRPTISALFLTLILAAFWPVVLLAVGWMLSSASHEVVDAVARSLPAIAMTLFFLQFVRIACRRRGVAAAHFGWSDRQVAALRGAARLLIVAGLPCLLLGRLFQLQNSSLDYTFMSRLCLIAYLLLTTYVLYRLFRPTSGVVADLREEDEEGRLKRSYRFWYPVVLIIPPVLAVLAIAGFSFTSFRLTMNLWRGVDLVFLLVLVGAMLFRWVRVKRRKIRRQQLLEAQQRATPDEAPPASNQEDLVVKEEEVDLVAIDQQMRRLIKGVLICVGLIGLSAIWIQDSPALAPLFQKTLWSVEGVGGDLLPVTFGAVLLAILVLVISVLAARNIPSLIDLMLLGQLGIESSTRYAISTLTQYTLVIVGVVFAFGALGFSWSKAQWLVAALGVGLGFGLQEIVANFVCGILLLFERPIRVGDIVTMGDTTGVVVRIRSRATTVRNWDRQEVVIPNKELITGRITNWTLSDHLNRVVIQVGIAYGSDTAKARALLFEIAEQNPNVLDEPNTLVTFEQFGDSSLNFIMRAYLANMDERLETIHQLHATINERFAKEGIEIAFPQRDLHVRSVDPSVRGQNGADGVWGDSKLQEQSN